MDRLYEANDPLTYTKTHNTLSQLGLSCPSSDRQEIWSITSNSPAPQTTLARRLGLFDATMIVMGGIIGSGIFINPYVVARQVTTPLLILAVWAAGGLIALAAAFIWAELSALRPEVGGQYAYLRDAYHPLIAFLYGWGLLLVIQTGGMAAVAVTFARYFLQLTNLPVSDKVIAASALLLLTIINCLGVRTGSSVQSFLMVLKILAIVGLIACGFWVIGAQGSEASLTTGGGTDSYPSLTTIGAAMVPVLFAYGGWQTSTFVAGEIREPRKNLPRALIIGVAGVVILYLAVNYVCVARTRSFRSGRHHHSCIRCDETCVRRNGRPSYCRGYCHLDAGLSQPGHAYCSSRLLRDGGRWSVFSRSGPTSCEDSGARGSDCPPGDFGNRDRALG